MSEKAIAIITARGGSKRIPKKNIKEFCGKPIIAYSIRAALDSGIFDEFMRSAKTSDDFATTADVLMEVLERYQEMDRTFDVMSCIYPTAPFVTPQKLQSAYDTLTKEQAVMAMPVVAFSYPPQRSYVLNGNMLEMKWKENYNKRSQDLEKMYHDAGQFYMYQVEAFVRLKGQMTESIVPVIVDEMEVQDIDNESDWKLAELKYQMIKMRNK